MSEGSIPTLQAAIVGLVIAAATTAFALGALSETAEQAIIAGAGTLIGAVFVIANELRHRTNGVVRLAKAQEAHTEAIRASLAAGRPIPPVA